MLPRTRSPRLPSLLLASLCLGPALRGQETPAPLAGIDAYIEKIMPAWQTPGLALAVVKDGAIVYAKGYGRRHKDRPEPVDADTLFAVASNSKAFTCALLAQLQEKNKLGFDDKVQQHLPWFRLHDALATRELNVLDLVVHRSGLPTFGGDHLWIGNDLGTREILERVRHLEASASFRSKLQYQNIMFTAAGEVLRAAGGADWHEAIQERILGPLDMSRSTTRIKAVLADSNHATPHEVRGGELVPFGFDDAEAIGAAAALNSSARDMARWLLMWLGQGKGQNGARILTPASVEFLTQMHTPIRVSAGRRRVLGQNFLGCGAGWFVHDYRGQRVIEHGGALSGMISKTCWLPEQGLGIVVLTNMAMNSLPDILARRIVDRYLGAPDRDYHSLYQGFDKGAKTAYERQWQERRAARHENTSPSLPLEAYTGTYHNPLPGDAKVSLREGKLHFFYNAKHRGFLEHWHHDTFKITWDMHIMDMDRDALLRFELDSAGKVKALHTRWYHPIRFDRKN